MTSASVLMFLWPCVFPNANQSTRTTRPRRLPYGNQSTITFASGITSQRQRSLPLRRAAMLATRNVCHSAFIDVAEEGCCLKHPLCDRKPNHSGRCNRAVGKHLFG